MNQLDRHPAIPHQLQKNVTSNGVPQPGTDPNWTPGRIPELDGLRGVAILMVVCLHYLTQSDGGAVGSVLYRFKQIFRLGWSGVDLFFILSGFLIGGILLQARDSENYYPVFYLRRVHRIFPIYYLWILLYFPIHNAIPHWIPNMMTRGGVGIRDISIYVLFLQNFLLHPINLDWGWLVATWSLSVEEQFYLIIPVLIRFLSRVSLLVVLCATVAVAPILRECFFRFFPHSFYWAGLMPCRADTLAIGILAAIAWREQNVRTFLIARRKSIYGILIFLFCGFLIMLRSYWGTANPLTAVFGFSWLAFFYATLLFTVLVDSNGKLARIMRWKWLMKLGGVSYCVYLIHIPINEMLHAGLLGTKPSVASFSGIGVTILAGALTFGIAVLSWKYLEEPMVRRGHRFRYRFGRSRSPEPGAIQSMVTTGADCSMKQG